MGKCEGDSIVLFFRFSRKQLRNCLSLKEYLGNKMNTTVTFPKSNNNRVVIYVKNIGPGKIELIVYICCADAKESIDSCLSFLELFPEFVLEKVGEHIDRFKIDRFFKIRLKFDEDELDNANLCKLADGLYLLELL